MALFASGFCIQFYLANFKLVKLVAIFKLVKLHNKYVETRNFENILSVRILVLLIEQHEVAVSGALRCGLYAIYLDIM